MLLKLPFMPIYPIKIIPGERTGNRKKSGIDPQPDPPEGET